MTKIVHSLPNSLTIALYFGAIATAWRGRSQIKLALLTWTPHVNWLGALSPLGQGSAGPGVARHRRSALKRRGPQPEYAGRHRLELPWKPQVQFALSESSVS